MARDTELTSLGRGAFHAWIGAHVHAVREKLRRGQQIAQIVADLGDCAAQRREASFLPQRAGQLDLDPPAPSGLAQLMDPARA